MNFQQPTTKNYQENNTTINEQKYDTKLLNQILEGTINVDFGNINNGYDVVHNTLQLSQSFSLSNQELYNALYGIKDTSLLGRIISFTTGKEQYKQQDIFSRANNLRQYLLDSFSYFAKKAEDLDYAVQQIDQYAQQFEIKSSECVYAYHALQQKGKELIECKSNLESFLNDDNKSIDRQELTKKHTTKEKHKQCVRSLHKIKASLSTLKRNKDIYEKHAQGFEAITELINKNLEAYMHTMGYVHSFITDLEVVQCTKNFHEFQQSFHTIFDHFENTYNLMQEHGSVMLSIQNNMNSNAKKLEKFDSNFYNPTIRSQLQNEITEDKNDFRWLEEDII